MHGQRGPRGRTVGLPAQPRDQGDARWASSGKSSATCMGDIEQTLLRFLVLVNSRSLQSSSGVRDLRRSTSSLHPWAGLTHCPQFPSSRYQLGQLPQAIEAFEKSLALQPSADAHSA